MAEQNNSTNANANGNSGGGPNNQTSTKKKPKKSKKIQQQQATNKFKGNDSDFEGKAISNKETMVVEFNELYQCLPSICVRRGYDYLRSYIKTMEAKTDDFKDFKEELIEDMDTSKYSKEIQMNVAKGENDAPVMVTKTIITNEILYKAASRKLEEENKEKRAKKNKYHKDSRLFLTLIKGQIEPTLFSLIKAQPGYKKAHREGKLI